MLPVSKKPSEQVPAAHNLIPVRCSVIQRTPKSTTKRDEDKEVRLPAPLIIQEPEQDQPIDYHIPKRRGETEDENEERKNREQRRSHCSKVSKPLISLRGIVGKLPITTSAAAGHGRSSSGAQGGGNQPSGGSSGGGGNMSFSGGSSGGNGGGSIGGGTGGGGMNPGRDGRQNYGPSSPPTGSLPPFYESLKGGNNGSGNYNGNFTGNAYMVNNQQNMDCDTGQELANLSMNGGHSPPKQYSTLQNASYGIVMKDESDLEIYETKIDQINNLFPGSYSGYEDSMMVDIPSTVVDPLQFTATLTFSSSAEQALLESLTDANDLSSYLQRLPNDDNESDEIIPNEMNNSESPQMQQVEQLDNFQEHMINRNYENQRGYPPQFSKMYQDQLPSYQSSVSGESLHVQMQQQQMLSPTLSFNGSALDLDSPTTMSLPSPGAASCSLDGGSHNETGSISPPANVSGRRDSVSSDTPSLQGRVNVLQQRVSSKLIQAKLIYFHNLHCPNQNDAFL